jgi:hypothetical protein
LITELFYLLASTRVSRVLAFSIGFLRSARVILNNVKELSSIPKQISLSNIKLHLCEHLLSVLAHACRVCLSKNSYIDVFMSVSQRSLSYQEQLSG